MSSMGCAHVMDNIVSAIEDRADTVIRQTKELYKAPVYKYPGDYARENGEPQDVQRLPLNVILGQRQGQQMLMPRLCDKHISQTRVALVYHEICVAVIAPSIQVLKDRHSSRPFLIPVPVPLQAGGPERDLRIDLQR